MKTRWASFMLGVHWFGGRWTNIYSMGEFHVRDSL